MAKLKLDFKLDALQQASLGAIKAGDVLLLEPWSAAHDAEMADAAAGAALRATGLVVRASGAGGAVLGSVPADVAPRLHAAGPLHVTVRSVKREPGAAGAVQHVLVRAEARSGASASGQPQRQAPTSTAPADDDCDFTLRQPQLQQLGHDVAVVASLRDERLQRLLVDIDSSSTPEKMLETALQQPDFREFADKVLAALGGGVSASTPAVTVS